MRLGSIAHRRRSTTDGSSGGHGCLCRDDGRFGFRVQRAEDYQRRRDLSEGALVASRMLGKKAARL
jgi:hypothetical protein